MEFHHQDYALTQNRNVVGHYHDSMTSKHNMNERKFHRKKQFADVFALFRRFRKMFFFFANNTYEVDEVTLSTSFSSASAYLADQVFFLLITRMK